MHKLEGEDKSYEYNFLMDGSINGEDEEFSVSVCPEVMHKFHLECFMQLYGKLSEIDADLVESLNKIMKACEIVNCFTPEVFEKIDKLDFKT